MSCTIHTVQLMYSSPYCAHGDEDHYHTVAAFTTEQLALAFVEWAEEERERIKKEAKELPYERWKEIEVPEVLKLHFPFNDYDSEYYHFQYDDEFDLDPEFEKERTA